LNTRVSGPKGVSSTAPGKPRQKSRKFSICILDKYAGLADKPTIE
jgi:hypothetical protein